MIKKSGKKSILSQGIKRTMPKKEVKKAKRGEGIKLFTKILKKEGLLLKKENIKKIWTPHFKDQNLNIGTREGAILRKGIIRKAEKDESLALRVIKNKGMLLNEENISKLKPEDFLVRSKYRDIRTPLDVYPKEWIELLKKTMLVKLKNGEYKHV